MHMDTKALFTQRFDAARAALAEGDEPAAAESLHWAIVTARTDPNLRRELASALFHLGKLSRKFGRAGEAEAETLLTEALGVSEELYGTEHAALAPVLNELSRLHLQQSQHTRAEEALERLLAIARLKGPEHLDVAAALGGLAFVKRKLADDASAEMLYREALRIREKVLEPYHTLTIGTLEQLSETCAALGNFPEALALLQRALPAREATLGPGHERVRAMRSRVAKLELEIAVATDTAAAEAARAARGATPTPAWLKRVPDSPVDTPSSAPSPVNSKALEFIGEHEPPMISPAPRSREHAKTPAVAAAVAAVSLMASSIHTPSASQIAIQPLESVSGRQSGAMHRDAVLADVVLAAVGYGEATGTEAAFDDRRSTFTSSFDDAPAAPRKKRTGLYASAGAAAVAVVLAGFLMSRPRTGSSKAPAPAETSVAQNTSGTGAPVMIASATTTASSAPSAAMAGAARPESLHSAAPTSAHTTAQAAQPEKSATETATPELRAPHVDVHVGSIALPSTTVAVNVDSMVRSAAERQRASDSERTSIKVGVTGTLPTAAPDVDVAHTSPKIIGRAPEPGFPDALLSSGPREGQVIVRFLVNERGTVDVASMVVEQSDNALFTAAVRDILPRFRFEPARTLGSDSKPVAAWVSVPFRFTTKKK